jgi:hypothetical protein
MIAETLAGIALIKQSVSFIKDQIDTCKDIGDIAGAIDKMFEGNSQMNSKRSGNISIADQFSTANVARETIDAKLAHEQMQEVATLINLRFGPGTWAGIIQERANRIQERKEAELIMRKKKAKEAKELIDGLKMIGWMVLFAVVVLGGMFAALKFYMT